MSTCFLRLLFLLHFFLVFHSSFSYPSQFVSQYLSHFGYLPRPKPGIADLRTDESVASAIRELQAFAGLEPNGRLDRPTRMLLATKRCGLPDRFQDGRQDFGPNSSKRRRKRYVHQGLKWDSTDLTYRYCQTTWQLSSMALHSLGWLSDVAHFRAFITTSLSELSAVSHFYVFDGGHSVVNSATTIPKDSVRRVIHDAFRTWSKVSVLTFRETRDPKADIQVVFLRGDHGDGYPFDGRDVVLAHAFFPSGVQGGDVHFDDDEQWTEKHLAEPHSREVSLLSVAVHELGHSLGLAHSNVTDSLMYPYYQYYMVDRGQHSELRLHYDDIVGIQKLYGSGGNPVPDRPPPTTSTSMPTTTARSSTTSTTATPARIEPPNICTTSIDAISTLRQEIFVFKDKWFWRFDENGQLNERPVELRRFWFDLPENATSIDAVYERKAKNQIVFFIGRHYYVFQGHRVLRDYPRPLTQLGLPESLNRIRCAFVWEYNGKTYLFGDGDEYWRLDESIEHVELDYPRKIDMNWHGIPVDMDAAFTDHLDRTLFFHGDRVYRFRGTFMNVARGYPKRTAEFWPYCRKLADHVRIE